VIPKGNLQKIDNLSVNQSVSWKAKIGLLLGRYGTLLCLGVLVIVFSALRPTIFPTFGNMINVFNQISLLGIIAGGLTVCMVMNDFDLSIGSVATLAAVLTAMALPNINIPLGILLVLLVGLFVGLCNGLLVTVLGVSAFLVTLGMMTILTGVNYWLTTGSGAILYQGIPREFLTIGKGSFLNIPYLIFFLIFFLLVLHLILNHTNTGRRMYSIGGNLQAARFSGINVRRLRITGFMISSFLATITGILLVARVSIAEPTIGDRFLFDSFTVVFLGAATIKIGQFHILGTLVGALIMGCLFSGFTILNVPFALQQMTSGVILIAAVAASGVMRRYRK